MDLPPPGSAVWNLNFIILAREGVDTEVLGASAAAAVRELSKAGHPLTTPLTIH